MTGWRLYLAVFVCCTAGSFLAAIIYYTLFGQFPEHTLYIDSGIDGMIGCWLGRVLNDPV